MLAAEGAAPEKLSPDVEAQARRLGRAAGEKIVAYAKEQGWLKADAVEAKPEAAPATLPQRRPAPKPAQKPEKPQDDPDDPNS